MTAPLRTILVGDALLPTELMVEAFAALGDAVEIVDALSWGPPDEAALDAMALRLEQEGPGAEPPPPELLDKVANADLLVVHYCPVSAFTLARATSLRVLATCRAGLENLDVEAATARGIAVLHTVGRTTEAVSDFAIGLLLAETRNIARAHSRLASGRWDKSFSNSAFTPELEGRTIGIVGYGQIGRAVARKLRGWNVRLLVHDPYLPDEDIESDGATPASLERLLDESDFITLHARGSAGDPPLIGAEQLAMMKPTSFLVNTARASLVDPAALYQALRNRRIAGAALDVHPHEPLDTNDPHLALENVTLTPHLASSTRDCMEKSPRLLAEDVRRLVGGERPQSVVNPEVLLGQA